MASAVGSQPRATRPSTNASPMRCAEPATASPPNCGARRAGAANIGVKPTFGGTAVTVEVHLLDFSGDLYGRELRVEFLERLRPEQRFGSVAELVGQIRRDVEAARGAVARAGVASRVP